MKRYLMCFSYDANNYYGYQKQPNLKTVQSTIEDALTSINNNHKVFITATGRTDRGVHAIKQYAHFDLSMDITCYKLKSAINANLPADIHINEVIEVNLNFHARHNVIKKEYQYVLNMGEYNPIERNYVYQYCKKLDVDKMKEAIKYFIGEHDFTSFISAKEIKEDKVRIIFEAKIDEVDNKLFITFIGNGFMKYQVRNMAGTLIEIGMGKKQPEDIKTILLSKNRIKAGITAEPQGLYLVNVWFQG